MALKRAPEAPKGGGDFVKLADYVNRVVVIEPTEETIVNSERYGETEATRAVALAWNEATSKLEDIGEVLIFWNRVRKQLAEALKTGDSVVGRLEKDGQAYVVNAGAVNDKTFAAIEKQML